MPEIFRIETDQVHLSWSGRSPSELDAHSTSPQGRLAISVINRATDIKVWRQGLPSEVSNDLAIEVGPRLYEETFYDLLLRSTTNAPVELRHRDPVILQALHSSAGGSIIHGTINFRSQIGRSR